MNFRKITLLAFAGLLALSLAVPGLARNLEGDSNAPLLKPGQNGSNPQENLLDINNQTIWVEKDGFFHWIDPFSGVNGTFPKGTAGTVFAQGLVWGGKVNDGNSPGPDNPRVNGSTYENGLTAGKVLFDNGSIGTALPSGFEDVAAQQVWRVRSDYLEMDENALNSSASQFFGKDVTEVTGADRDAIIAQYEHDWEEWPAEKGAPFEDVDNDGNYDPTIDIPGYPGADQTVWIVAHDMGGASAGTYGSPPIGVELQMTMWAYDFPSNVPLGNIGFIRNRLIYTGLTSDLANDATDALNATIDSMYVVHWVDPDVGDAGDDYAGSDSTLSLGFAYNGAVNDPTYLNNFGLPAPATGWDFLQGPIVDTGSGPDTLGMSSFTYFAAGSAVGDPDLGDYEGTLQWYNLMRGFLPRPAYPDGEPWINPNTGQASKFTLPGDPVTGSGWIDGQLLPPGDRRIVMTAGPFTMAVGDTQDVVVGQVSALGTNNLSSVSLLKFYDEFAQYAYDQNFDLPATPPAPNVSSTMLDGSIVLNWGENESDYMPSETHESKGFVFEGYNVYQLPQGNSPLSEGVKIATFDKKNLSSIILGDVFDEETGFVVEKPVLQSPNTGLQRFIEIDRDEIRSRPLANGVNYHYAITAYSIIPGVNETPFALLESSPTTVTVTPQPNKPGTSDPTAVGTVLDVTHSEGESTADVTAEVVDPEKLKDSDYQITFNYYDPVTGTTKDTLAAADTLDNGDPWPLRWNLVSGSQTIKGNMEQLLSDTPTSEAPILNGVQVVVPKVDPGFADWTYEGDRWVTGVNWGGSQFFGGADIGAAFFGSNLGPEDLVTVIMEFQGDTTSGPADGWASKGAVYRRDLGYAYDGTGYLPFAAYELNPDGTKGRQLNVSFVEDADDGVANLRWDMGWDGSAYSALGGREYTFIHDTDYNEGATYDGTTDGTSTDVLYAFWPDQRGSRPFLLEPFTMTFIAAKSNTPGDIFAFNTTAVDSGLTDSLEANIDLINVFPNPYYGYQSLETGRFNKFVTFTHLPEKATIRLFNLAGIMVRKIEHDSESQFERWDLTNQDELPVASGIYIAHIETEYGSKVLKLAIVQEQQILQRY